MNKSLEDVQEDIYLQEKKNMHPKIKPDERLQKTIESKQKQNGTDIKKQKSAFAKTKSRKNSTKDKNKDNKPKEHFFKSSTKTEKSNIPFVSIIVLNYNGAKFVRNCLNTLLNINYPTYEVVFVDNCSADNSLEIATMEFKHFSRLKIYKLQKNLGYTGGNNFGARYTHKKSEYLLFLNIDTEVEPNFLLQLVKIMESDYYIGAAQPKLLMQDKKHIDSMGASMDVLGIAQHIGCLKRDFGQYDKSREVFYAKGAALLIRKQLFIKVGKFDEDFFLWRDEVDICWRIWLHGFKVINIPSSTVYHYGSGITNEIYSNLKIRFFFFFTRNNLMMLIKNYELNNLVKYLSLFIFFQALASIYNSLKTKSWLFLAAFIKAIIWNIFNLKRTLIKRQKVQKKIRRLKDEEILNRVISTRPFFINQLCSKLFGKCQQE